MLLSALTLAAMLQAAPAAASVVIPEVAPVVGQKGHLLQRKPFDPAQRVDQLTMRSPQVARPVKAFKAKAPRVSCDSNGPSRASHPEPLMAQPLSKLPKAHGERAVARSVDGCPVSVLIARNDPLH